MRSPPARSAARGPKKMPAPVSHGSRFPAGPIPAGIRVVRSGRPPENVRGALSSTHMEKQPSHDTMHLLAGAGRGESAAMAGLTAMVYDELRALAAAYLRRERAGHSLQPTALVHEAFLKLIDSDGLAAKDRRHFFAIAANTMRRVLVEHARTRGADKRGGGQQRVTLTGNQESRPDAGVKDV